ncbi:serine/threonine-protein kinase pim-2-like [Pseudorasbora parva]|uniref:serine/threonine-protein kinase pim-2-like n=1 Tax=Pseudorasbora parva TaxID=51549 RepID=UPI00351EE854
MGQSRSKSHVSEHDVCMAARPAQKTTEKKKKGGFFRWARKSKKTSVDAQESQCTVDKNQQPETIDGQESQCGDDATPQRETVNVHQSQCGEDATPQPERCSDHVSDTESTSESSCGSFHTANEDFDTLSVDLSLDEAEMDSCSDSWVSCVSSFTPEPEMEEHHLEHEQASTSSEESSSSSSEQDTAWTHEDELINLSLKGKTGDILQHYECLGLLGRGSHGNVFAGIRRSDSQQVALKYVEKSEFLRVFRTGPFGKTLPNEVAMMALLTKGPGVPQIIKLLDWYETPDEYILVLERPTPCVNMQVFLLQRGGRIVESVARAVMRQVVTAARICCERGIFHGDIKLENLLINENTLQVKLIDFRSSLRLRKSEYYTFCGTSVYRPPESLNHGKFHCKPATVYSLGVVLFKILSGRYPRSPKQLEEILTEPWYTEEISKECQDLISACLESDPAQRISLEKILLHDWFQALILD